MCACSLFNVPRKTLDDIVKGRVKHGSKPGVYTALTFLQEKSLVNYLLYMAERGFLLTRSMVQAFDLAIAKHSACAYCFKKSWVPVIIVDNYSRSVIQSLRCVYR